MTQTTYIIVACAIQLLTGAAAYQYLSNRIDGKCKIKDFFKIKFDFVPLLVMLIAFFASVFVFLLAMSGIGLSLSTICKTQQQSVLGMCLLSAPLMMLSGFMSPIENMSWLAQKIAMVNPLTYFFELLKGIFLRNIGMITIFENIVPLILIAGVTLTFSWWFFNKNLS